MGEDARRRALGLGQVHNMMPQPGQQFEVDMKNATPQVCGCGCDYFQPAIRLYKISALMSPIGKEMMAQQPAVICVKCGKPFTGESKTDVIDIEKGKDNGNGDAN